MATNSKQIFGIVTTIAVVGVAAYSIKKYYDVKKQNAQAIDLEEAKQIVKEEKDDIDIELKDEMDIEGIRTDAAASGYPKSSRNVLNDGLDMEDVKFGARDSAHYDPASVDVIERDRDKSLTDEQIDEIRDQARDQASYDANFMTTGTDGQYKIIVGIKPEDLEAAKQAEVAEEEVVAWYEGPDLQEIEDSKGYYDRTKEVMSDLKYEPNSIAAREQFIAMEMALLGRDNDVRDIVSMLYDHPFVPTCDEDQHLKTRLVDHRIRFFGLHSQWSQAISFGDVIMYYGKASEYNVGNSVYHWVDYFLKCIDLNEITMTSAEIEERITTLNKHNYHNADMHTFGLFGLSANQMTEACAIARGRIDECVTYDIEFHQFIQGVI